MTYRDIVPTLRRVWKILRNRILYFDFALFRRQHHGSCRELFRDGSKLKYRIRLYRHIMFEVCKTITFHLDDLAATNDNEGQTRNLALVHLKLNVIIYLVGLCRN